MAAAPQTQINFTTPTQFNDGSSMVAGSVSGYIAQINGSTYNFVAPATWAPGSVQDIPFASLTPSFAPVGGTAYIADLEAVSAGQDSVPSASVSWTQNAKSPLPPTALSVS